MKPSKEREAQSSLKKDAVVQFLRNRIVSGELAPGHQLPTRTHLEKQFAASIDTVQRALDRLVDDGFVVVNGRRGTFVAPHPPHLSRYALVFDREPSKQADLWTRFSSALFNEATLLNQTHEREMVVFTGVDGHREHPAYLRLVNEIYAERLAGIVFATGIHNLEHTPLLDHPNLPRVIITTANDLKGAVVRLDEYSFVDKAIEFCVQRGRRRLAVISHQHTDSWLNTYLRKKITEANLDWQSYLLQTCFVQQAVAARNIAHLLMHLPRAERPDALLITDDNLVEHATLGLQDAEIRVPTQLEVIAHCNFPYPPSSYVPVTRLGYDTNAILQTCINSIDEQRRGEEGNCYDFHAELEHDRS